MECVNIIVKSLYHKDLVQSTVTFKLFWQSEYFCNWHIYNYQCREVGNGKVHTESKG